MMAGHVKPTFYPHTAAESAVTLVVVRLLAKRKKRRAGRR